MLPLIEQKRIVPVVVFHQVDDVVPTLKALRDGGLPIAEITFRTDCAEQAIALAIKHFPDMLIGAGTVISPEQCERAIDLGVKFIVSPGLSEDVAKVCAKRSISYFPGVVSPTEIMHAIALGLFSLKFFPAESFGGLKTIKAISAAFPQVRFMPTGGIGEENLCEYLSCSKVFACGGSWMMKGTYEEITELTRRAVLLAERRK